MGGQCYRTASLCRGRGRGRVRGSCALGNDGVPWGMTAASQQQQQQQQQQQRKQVLQRPLHPRKQQNEQGTREPGTISALNKKGCQTQTPCIKQSYPSRRRWVWLSVLALGLLLHLHTFVSWVFLARRHAAEHSAQQRLQQARRDTNASHSQAYGHSRSHSRIHSRSHLELGTLSRGFRGRVDQSVAVDRGTREKEMRSWGDVEGPDRPSLSQLLGRPAVAFRKRKELQGLEGFHIGGAGRSHSDSDGHSHSDGHSDRSSYTHSSTRDSGKSGTSTRRVCIAIPSIPRASRASRHGGNPGSEGGASLVTALLQALRSKRIGTSSVHFTFQAVVYSAACPSEHSSKGSSNRSKQEGGLSDDSDPARLHLAEIQTAILGSAGDLQARVIGPSEELCSLFRAREYRAVVGGGAAKKGYFEWRTKENVDFLYVVRQCLALQPDYVLFLEDDTAPAMAYDDAIQHFVEVDLAQVGWAAASLYFPQSLGWKMGHMSQYKFPCCTQAVLFKPSTLRGFVEHIDSRFFAGPIDWLLQDYLDGANLHAYVHVPSIFQHVGHKSTNTYKGSSRGFHSDLEFSKYIFLERLTRKLGLPPLNAS